MALRQPPPEEAKTILQRWVSENGLSARQFTKLLGDEYNFKYISYIIAGSKKPSVSLAKIIEGATNGEVPAVEMLGLK